MPGLTSWSEEEKKAMEEYGISKQEFEDYISKTVKRIKDILKNPEKNAK